MPTENHSVPQELKVFEVAILKNIVKHVDNTPVSKRFYDLLLITLENVKSFQVMALIAKKIKLI